MIHDLKYEFGGTRVLDEVIQQTAAVIFQVFKLVQFGLARVSLFALYHGITNASASQARSTQDGTAAFELIWQT